MRQRKRDGTETSREREVQSKRETQGERRKGMRQKHTVKVRVGEKERDGAETLRERKKC